MLHVGRALVGKRKFSFIFFIPRSTLGRGVFIILRSTFGRRLIRRLTLAACALQIVLLSSYGGSSLPAGPPPPPPPPPPASNNPFWGQWGAGAQHNGSVSVAAQGLNHQLADIVYDPFVAAEQRESFGDLLAHYQATLMDGNDFYMEIKSGTYPACATAGDWQNGAKCGPNAWEQLTWNVARYTWGERDSDADLDVCFGLEAGAERDQWAQGMGASVSSCAGEWVLVCAGRGRNSI